MSKPRKKDIERFEKTAQKLNNIIEKIQEYCPNIIGVYSQSSCSLSLCVNNDKSDDLHDTEAVSDTISFNGTIDSCY